MSLDETLDALDTVIAAKPGGSHREGQSQMAQAVADAMSGKRHLLVEAGTGTGKSFAYIVPAIVSGQRVVISTATKSLQDQLDRRDIPFIAEALSAGFPVTWQTVKGRASYVCKARLLEHTDVVPLDLFSEPTIENRYSEIADWAIDHPTGDRDDLPFSVDDETWSNVSVSGTECPGRDNCPVGSSCFAMQALDRAAEADIVIVNHHLYGTHLMSERGVLPDHEVVIFDEGHRLEDTFASAFGFELAPWRFRQLERAARYLRGVAGSRTTEGLLDDLARAAEGVDEALAHYDGTRVAVPSDLKIPFEGAARVVGKIRKLAEKTPAPTQSQEGAKARLIRLAGHLEADLALGHQLPDGYVAWVDRKSFNVAPIHVGEKLADLLLHDTTVVVTSATLSAGGSLLPLANALGFEADQTTGLRAPSPFDYQRQGRIYVASHLPEPNSADFPEAASDEIVRLVRAAGGRSLILTTSYRNLDRFSEALLGLDDFAILTQGDLPKRQLLEKFEEDETSVLVATMGFWEGVDVVGRSLELVVLDRLPFPRPNDPLWEARREAAELGRHNPFMTVDLPRAAMLTAQGAGRLIRSTTDRGVVALLDSRVASRRYGRTILNTLPPMPVLNELRLVEEFLADH